MDELKPLSDFFTAIENDGRISLTHIGVYAAILQHWKAAGCPVPLRLFSYEIMRVAKISAHMTWHRTIRDLNDFGYLRYEPSFKRNERSKVYLLSGE